MVAWLSPRSLTQVEVVDESAYCRAIELDGAFGTVAVRPGTGALLVTVKLSRPDPLPQVIARLRKLFDVEADTSAIARHLSRDRLLRPLVAARPGLRVPGAWDPFELAVRAILGQQISVAAARTLACRIVDRFGPRLPGAGPAEALRRTFPSAQRLAEADLSGIGLTSARARALGALARAAADDPRQLQPEPHLNETVEKLCQLPGVGPWTAHYIALRAFGDRDAFPASDLGLLRASGLTPAKLALRAEAWRPYRAYAALHLWSSL